MNSFALPESLVQLAQLLGELLGGPPAPVAAIDEPTVMLALRRQHVGPLLYAAAANGSHLIAAELLQRLEQSYRTSAARRASAQARLHQIAAEFAALGIDWMVLKGVTQAEQLYADAAWRDSSDIDILVPPREFPRALDALLGLGFIASNPPMPAARVLRKPILAAVRDVTLIARDDHNCAVELHSRLFFASGRRSQALRLEATPGALPAPAIGPDLACYMIAHGAISFWVRLKWLVDLVPLFAKLSDLEKLSVLDRVQRASAENSVAASLLLLRALFPFAALGPLTPWLAHKELEPAVKRRLRRYADVLGLDRDWKRSPLDNALMALESSWMLFETPAARARILLLAPPSSLARRIAGAFSKSARALTLSDAPP